MGVNDETLDDGQQDQGDEQEEGEVEDDSDVFVVGTVRGLDHISDATTSPDTLVHVEDEAGENVVAHLVGILALLTLSHVEFAEEVESENRVDVANDGEKTDREDELLAVVGDGLQDDPESGNSNGNVDQVSGKEEVVVVSEDGEDKVEDEVEEGAVSDGDSHLPHLVPPVYSLDCRKHATAFFLLRRDCRLLHAKNLREGVKLVVLLVLLPHPLLHKLVPVVDREGLGRDDQLIPVALQVVILRLLSNVDAVKLHLSGHLFLTLEDGQGNLEVVVGDQHAEGEKAVDNSQASNAPLEVPVLLFHMDVLLGTLLILSLFTLLTTFVSISSVSSISNGLIILHVCVTHAVILNHLLVHGNLRDFVEKKHEVDDEGDDQGKELDGEEVPGEEAGQLLCVLANVNLWSTLRGGCSLLLLCLVGSPM